MTSASPEQRNFFKFSTVVFDEIPVALRQVFVYLWDNLVAIKPGFQKWDDSPMVRNMFLRLEGGRTGSIPTSKSYHQWESVGLFEATLYSKSFSLPDGRGQLATLNKRYIKPLKLPFGAFHQSVLSPSGNQFETFALALDQLRLLRITLVHANSTNEISKAVYGNYIRLTKDAFTALGITSAKVDELEREIQAEEVGSNVKTASNARKGKQ